jgi:hypothetical protein
MPRSKERDMELPDFFKNWIRVGNRYDIPMRGKPHYNGMKLSIQGKSVQDIIDAYSALFEYLDREQIAHKVATSKRINSASGPQKHKIITIYIPDEAVGLNIYGDQVPTKPEGWRAIAEEVSTRLHRAGYTGWHGVRTPPKYEHYSNAVFFRNDRDDKGSYVPADKYGSSRFADFFREVSPPDELTSLSNGSPTSKNTSPKDQGGSSLPNGDSARNIGRPSPDSPNLKYRDLDRKRPPAEKPDLGYVHDSGSGSARVIPYDSGFANNGTATSLKNASKNVPVDDKLWAEIQALAKGESSKPVSRGSKSVKPVNEGKGFTTFPSAYANGWALAQYKRLGGKWKKEGSEFKTPRKWDREHCESKTCDEMGFSEKASCRPYKNCYKKASARRVASRYLSAAKRDDPKMKNTGKGGLDTWFAGHGGGDPDDRATWGDWVAITPIKHKVEDKEYEAGDIVGPCAVSSEPEWAEVTSKGKKPLKCMPREKAWGMSKEERASLARVKRREENKHRGQKPVNTPTFSKEK